MTGPHPVSLSAVQIALLKEEVIAAERTFARSMADRDHAAFSRLLSDECVFFPGKVLRGKQAVADA